MAKEKRENVRDEDITGLKVFGKLLPLFEQLYEVGCERDKAGTLGICPPAFHTRSSFPAQIPGPLACPIRLCNNRAEQDWFCPLFVKHY